MAGEYLLMMSAADVLSRWLRSLEDEALDVEDALYLPLPVPLVTTLVPDVNDEPAVSPYDDDETDLPGMQYDRLYSEEV